MNKKEFYTGKQCDARRILSFILTVLMILLSAFGGYKMEQCWAEEQARFDRSRTEEELENDPCMESKAGAFSVEITTTENEAKDISKNDSAQSAENERVSLGIFTITAYCPCSVCCGKWSDENAPVTASGMPAEAGKTAGADWDILPCGTEVEIGGVGQRTVQDKPAKWVIQKYDGRILDLYFDSHEEALDFGKKEAEVWILDSTTTKASR